MKKTILSLLAISTALFASAEIRVLSDVKLGEGYFPRFADAETVTYLTAENARYVAEPVDMTAELRVDNEISPQCEDCGSHNRWGERYALFIGIA